MAGSRRHVRSEWSFITGRSLELPGVVPWVGEVEHAGLEGRRGGELQRHLVAGLGEQPLAAAVHDREDEQVQFAQWAFPEQPADQGPAVPDRVMVLAKP